MSKMSTEFYRYTHPTTNKTESVYRSPNQRIIQIHLYSNNHKSIHYESHIQARATLSKNAFQLFDFFEFHKDKTVIALSSKYVYEVTQLTENTYSAAFNELLEKGYLEKHTIGCTYPAVTENAYYFYENPSIAETIKSEKVSKFVPLQTALFQQSTQSTETVVF